MNKKEYILKILKKLEKDWNLASLFIKLVNNIEKKEDMDFIFSLFKKSVDDFIIANKKKHFKKIKNIEIKENDLKLRELDNLEKELEKLF